MYEDVRPELSRSNDFWVERHRYYELKHFCMQYPIWQKQIILLDGYIAKPNSVVPPSRANTVSDPTAMIVIERDRYKKYIKLIEDTAKECDEFIQLYLIKGVTDGVSYDYLSMKLDIPCSRSRYYNSYRKFFWLLDMRRD